MLAIISIVQLTRTLDANDLWWHILHGKYVIQTGSLIVDHSVFTWTPSIGHFYNTWIADVILYQLNKASGPVGLVFLRTFIYVFMIVLAWIYAARCGIAKHPLVWAVIFIGQAFMWPSYPLRPELFSFIFMTLFVLLYYELRIKGDTGWYLPYFYPLLLVIWVNTHGAFFIASLFFASIIIGDLLNLKLSSKMAFSPKLRKHLYISLGLCFPALLINPFGYELPIQIIHNVITADVVAYNVDTSYKITSHFNSAPWYLLDYLLFAMVIFITLLWRLVPKKRVDWVIVISFLAFSFIFVQLVRVTYFLGPVFIFASLYMLNERKDTFLWPKKVPGQLIFFILTMSIMVFFGQRIYSLYACDFLSPQSIIGRAHNSKSPSPLIHAEADFIEKHLSGVRIGNMPNQGGYLEYRFWPDKKPMIDTRIFPFRHWIDPYLQQINTGVSISQMISNANVDFWLAPHDTHLQRWLTKSPLWRVVFFGPDGIVFIPTSSSEFKGAEVSSMIDELMSPVKFFHAFVSAMQLPDVKYVEKILSAAKSNLVANCGRESELINEMNLIVKAYYAFDEGHYNKAVQLLGERSNYFDTTGKARSMLALLASDAWEHGNYVMARKFLVYSAQLSPQNSVPSIYNLALADWHVRHSKQSQNTDFSDGWHWRMLVELIIQKSENLPVEQKNIIENARRMLEGTYSGHGKFLQND